MAFWLDETGGRDIEAAASVEATVVGRFVIYALRRIGVTAPDRARVPTLYDEFDFEGHVRGGGKLTPAHFELTRDRLDPTLVLIRITCVDPLVVDRARGILGEYEPAARPTVVLEQQRKKSAKVRSRILKKAGWKGTGTMPPAAVEAIMAAFSEETDDPASRGIWLNELFEADVEEAEQERLVSWLFDGLDRDELEDEWFAMGQLVARYALPTDAEALTALVRDSRLGQSRLGLIEALSRVSGGEATPVLTELLEDPTARLAALESLARVGSAEHVDAVRRFVDDEQPAVRRAARRALAKMGASVEPVFAHAVSQAVRFSGFEWSANLDVETVGEAMRAIGAPLSSGLGPTELAEIQSALDHLEVGTSLRLQFEASVGEEQAKIGLELVMEDEDAVDLFVFAPDVVCDSLDAWWAASQN